MPRAASWSIGSTAIKDISGRRPSASSTRMGPSRIPTTTTTSRARPRALLRLVGPAPRPCGDDRVSPPAASACATGTGPPVRGLLVRSPGRPNGAPGVASRKGPGMSILRKAAIAACVAAGALTTGAFSAAAGPLPTNIAAVKTAASTDVVQARWGGHGGWGGGGWGRGGWGRGGGWFPGAAVVGGLAAGLALGGYGYGDGYPYDSGYGYGGYYPASYGYYGGPYYASYGGGYGGYYGRYYGRRYWARPYWGYRGW